MRAAESIEELAENPTRFGMPTFEQFVKNKEKYLGRADDEIAAIDRGDPALGCRQRYYIENYRVDSLEQAERIAREMGYSLFTDFVVDPQVKQETGGSLYTQVTFRPKAALEKRSQWR